MSLDRATVLCLGLIVVLFGLQFALPEYERLILTRVLVLATFAVGYNILYGYTGLLSLGHAMFFAAGLYGSGLPVYHLGWSAPLALLGGVVAGLMLAMLVGAIALRTSGVAFMIVTMMFAQAFFLLILYFGGITRGDEGLTMPAASRQFSFLGNIVDLTSAATRYNLALLLFVIALMVTLALVRSPSGRVLVAIRENEDRARMLGYDSFRYKLFALTLSGVLAAAAGAAYALLFAYVGATFASIQYSIFPLLWTLLGGAGTVIGPFLGTLAMTLLVDRISEYTSAYLLVVGVLLVLLILFFPRGVLGSIRDRWLPWLP
jgi:branched-chain amino acid transport system permease protein